MGAQLRRHVGLLVMVAFVFGVLTAGGVAYATIPDGAGVIHACYSPTLGPGALRVIDTDLGQTCHHGTEHSVNWSQTGVPGPPGTAGPTVLVGPVAGTVTTAGVTLVSHTVTAAEAGLAIVTAPVELFDDNGAAGGTTRVSCSLLFDGSGGGFFMSVSDNGNGAAFHGNTTSETLGVRALVNAGEVVSVECNTGSDPGDSGEAEANGYLQIEHVNS